MVTNKWIQQHLHQTQRPHFWLGHRTAKVATTMLVALLLFSSKCYPTRSEGTCWASFRTSSRITSMSARCCFLFSSLLLLYIAFYFSFSSFAFSFLFLF